MHIKFGILCAGLMLSSPAYAQSYNGFVAEPSYDYSSTSMSWATALDRNDSPARVLAQLRAMCSSNKRYDQYYCARGIKVLKKAYVEYKLRLEARAAAAQ